MDLIFSYLIMDLSILCFSFYHLSTSILYVISKHILYQRIK